MCLHVSFQLAGLAASMITEMTLEGFLACMGSAMNYQVALKLERLPAELARLALR